MHLDPPWELQYQCRPWPWLHECLPTKLTAANSRPTPTTGAPVICSDVLLTMSLQRHLSVNPLKLQSRQTWLKFQPCFQSHVAPGDLLRFQPRFHVWATLPRLHTPRAHTGRAIPTASTLRMRLLSWGPTSPFACMLTMGLLKWTWALSCTHSQLWTGQHSSPFRLSPCSQPQSSPQVCPLKPEFQHPAPTCTIRYMSPSGEYSEVARIVCVGLALFCLPQASCCTLP